MVSTTASSTKFNVLSIVGFILSFLGWIAVVGLILDLVALSQIKRTGERGRRLAIAGVIIAIVMIVFNIYYDVAVLPGLMSSISH